MLTPHDRRAAARERARHAEAEASLAATAAECIEHALTDLALITPEQAAALAAHYSK